MRKQKSKNPFINMSKQCHIKPFDIEEIALDHQGLNEIQPDTLSLFPNLQSLYIPNNNLYVLANLDANIRLKMIDARNNKIKKVNLGKQLYLIELYLANNNITNLIDFLGCTMHLKSLEILDLRQNGIIHESRYKHQMIKAFPSLKILDGIDITHDKQIINERKLHQIKDSTLATRNPQTQSQHRFSDVKTKKNIRAKSVLDFIKNSPLSAPDLNIVKKANHIKQTRNLFNNSQHEASVFNKDENNKEEMLNIEAPIPDGLDFLKKSDILNKCDVSGDPKRRSNRSRSYLKAATFAECKNLKPEEEIFLKMNPNIGSSSLSRKILSIDRTYA
ncbi:hypothetical protein TRFO_20786 [Tritrichomonas foetus]|uniref:Leucine Rich Repeat family protein n=1 Tax=Tritrichomonas foetus TaxID=1144522 RepID=A0A1J4KF28_9EUKA|nr:hypothetical protein TRFO_20786 [Tritrichomonas foetus]|eukprot:OHT10065.1 hypothetical protein TRFO_20786 [Tritrichomonas foetus]